MKVVILGGSSQSTPSLFDYFGSQAGCPELDVVLIGRSSYRLAAVERASRMLAALAPVSVHTCLLDRSRLSIELRGADVVLIQMRIGGFLARQFDESFPLDYGLCGDEGLGPGGLASAWRSWPQLASWLDIINSTCPDAAILMLSSPLSILVRAVIEMYPALRVLGICELPWTTLQQIGRDLGVPIGSLDFDYVGVNHIGWFYRLEADGRNLLYEYIELREDQSRFPSSSLMRRCMGFPTKYLRMHYDSDSVVREQRDQTESRAQTLKTISRRNFETYLSGDVKDIKSSLLSRHAPWYSEAIGPLLFGLAGKAIDTTLFLSKANDGLNSNCQPNEVLEGAWSIRHGRLVPHRNCSEPPVHIMKVVKSYVIYEGSACRAILNRDTDQLGIALTLHPWVQDKTIVPHLVNQIVSGSNLAEQWIGGA